MNEFMKILLSLSASGALLLLLILGLKPLYRNKFSRRWQYYIWIIAALRFLLPLTFDTTIVGSLFERFDKAAITNDIPTSPEAPISINTDNSKTEPIQTNRDVAAAAMGEPINIYICLFFIWSILALTLFVRKVTLYQGFIQYIKAGNREVSDIKILNLLSDCKEKLHIKARVELACNPLIASPVVTGFFRPKIILPVAKLEDRELSYIFVHELIHYKQRDMFYKWLIQIVVCVHWFNPLVYLLEREVNKACELSCDEKVISILDDRARREYGDTLISFLKSGNLYKSSLASVTLTEGAEQLKERLGAIMKFEKKSKTVITFTIICSVLVCVCFLATGAYAAPSVTNDMKTWKDSEILNEVLTDKGVYYIFCEGAGEEDKPQASVSAGSIKFVVVRKGSWTSVGPFNNKETLVEDVIKQCEQMKSLTEKEKESIIETAANIEKSSRYTYVQRGYYSDSYIIEMGWNLNDTISKQYTDSKVITLEDNSTIQVYFGGLPFGYENGNAVEYLNDSHAVSAIAKLLYSLKNTDMPNYPTLETPLITNITYVGEKNLSTLAEEYFKSSNSMGFSAIFTALDTELQEEYCRKIYDNDKVALFVSIMPRLDRDFVILYADKAVQDRNTYFFAAMLPQMPSDVLDKYASQYYEADDTSGFAVTVPHMTTSEKQKWLIKAETDKKNTFSAILSAHLPE